MLASASCTELSNQTFLEGVIKKTGLANSSRGDRLFGPGMGAYMVQSRNPKISLGVYQLPEQLSVALLYLSSLQIRSYLELGIFAGWTACIISSYLRRFAFAHGEHAIANGKTNPHFRGWALDINLQRISHASAGMLRTINVQPMLRSHFRFDEASKIDLCFIDASHTMKDVKDDYLQFWPHCKYVMFHDVFDHDTAASFSDGGVPRFWADLKANLHRERWVEFAAQKAIFPTTLGIGLVLPHADGTARPDWDWSYNSASPSTWHGS